MRALARPGLLPHSIRTAPTATRAGSNTDCGPGSRCVKRGGIYGVCPRWGTEVLLVFEGPARVLTHHGSRVRVAPRSGSRRGCDQEYHGSCLFNLIGEGGYEMAGDYNTALLQISNKLTQIDHKLGRIAAALEKLAESQPAPPRK